MGFMPLGGVELLIVVLMQIAVLALVVLGILWLVRRLSTGDAGPSASPRSARDELEMRYARGEIDRTTYLQMQEDVKRGGSG